MAAGISTRDGRQQILEGLWLIGIEPGQLGVSPDLDENAFLSALHKNGVHDEFIRRAIAGVDWRVTDKGPGALMYRIEEWLKVAGYRQDEVDAFRSRAVSQGINNETGLMKVLAEQFNERTAGALMHKVTAGRDIRGAVWNPFRTDSPPENANLKFGAGGMAAGVLPEGWRSIEPSTRQVATPPGVVQPGASARSGVPPMPGTTVSGRPPGGGAPTLSGQVPGAGGPAATGGGGGPGAGGTPPPRKLTPAEIRADLESRYGWAAAFADIPEVAKILVDAANGTIDATEADRRWKSTEYYRQSTTTEIAWRTLEKTNPGEAAFQLEGQVNSITTRARGLGVDLDPARARQIAELSKRHGWSDQQIAAAIASEAKYDPTGAKTGIMASIKQAQQSQLVPMSDQSMTQWAQAIIGGSKSIDDFNVYLKNMAKSLFPTMANYLDTTPGGTVKQYLTPYSETISKTLGMPAGDIDWSDPKWFRFVNASDPKTGERKMIDIADVQRTIIADPTYGYDKTAAGKQSKANLARTILEQWGFVAGSGSSPGGGF